MDINVHNVVKIEVKPRTDLTGFSTREIVIHSKDYDYDVRDYVEHKFTVNCFVKDKETAKLFYSKK
jgi:hypothetical protein